MSKSRIVINCLSTDDKLKKQIKSIVHVLDLVGGLKKNWVYADDNVAVHIIDVDNGEFLLANSGLIIIAISSNPELLNGQKYSLTKPIRNQTLQVIFKQIESSNAVEQANNSAISNSSPPNARRVVVEDDAKVSPLVADSKVKLYKLQAWPDISQMHDDVMLDASRVSALLAMRPANLNVISSLLDLSTSRIEYLLSEISSCSHSGYPCLAESPTLSDLSGSEHVADVKVVAKPASILSKIWNRLKGAA